MRVFSAVFAAAASFAAPLAFAQAPSSLLPLDAQQIQSIDNFVASEMARQKIPGLALGIYSRGKILLAKGYGMSNVELSVPVKPETRLSIWFCRQAVRFGGHHDAGGRRQDQRSTTASRSTFPTRPPWKPILIKNLLSHTSGLPNMNRRAHRAQRPFYLRLDFTEDQLVEKIETLPIDWQAGEKWDYRNTNYVLLGIIIHKVTGKPYADFLRERIFKPLGMTSTRLISEATSFPTAPLATNCIDGELKNQEWVSPTFDSTADGALYFNVLDIAKWDAALYGTTLLKQSSLDRMWTVFPLTMASPILPTTASAGLWRCRIIKRTEHGGAWQGFTCVILRYPDDNLSVAVLTNLDGGHANPGIISHVVSGMVIPALQPAKLSAIPDKDPSISSKVAKLLDQIVAGEDIRPQATPQLAALITPEAAVSVGKRLAAVWPGGTMTLVKRDAGSKSQPVSTFRITKGSEAILIVYGLDQDGKIATLGIAPNREYE